MHVNENLKNIRSQESGGRQEGKRKKEQVRSYDLPPSSRPLRASLARLHVWLVRDPQSDIPSSPAIFSEQTFPSRPGEARRNAVFFAFRDLKMILPWHDSIKVAILI